MSLYLREWGDGERVAVLVHGMTTDSGSWWRLGPALAERGYRVLAPDLPGHGRSARGEYTLRGMAEAVTAAVPANPALAIGHSLGGLVLAAAVGALRPARAVYVDPPWGTPPGEEVAAFLRAQQGWTLDQLTAFHPAWPAEAVREKHAALSRWDPETLGLVREYPGARTAPVPSLVVRGDLQPMVGETLAGQLRAEGFVVRVAPGTGHVVHNDDFETFVRTLEGWL
ncbi:alpha/beta hydrolase [Amycolatopsis acidicola]|uniref:Alpha/beta hydrolase n=1 Tax=Amycolatopsis acidicola TaxID=2596893 RepID=A0A5N0UX89_9PSEU|nr:alpha/beta fold hydrolase [Amycolatopsis acidicola]KAA9156924.1 alpha/beta hydrolase [Amycolatopsis acidicola]